MITHSATASADQIRHGSRRHAAARTEERAEVGTFTGVATGSAASSRAGAGAAVGTGAGSAAVTASDRCDARAPRGRSVLRPPRGPSTTATTTSTTVTAAHSTNPEVTDQSQIGDPGSSGTLLPWVPTSGRAVRGIQVHGSASHPGSSARIAPPSDQHIARTGAMPSAAAPVRRWRMRPDAVAPVMLIHSNMVSPMMRPHGASGAPRSAASARMAPARTTSASRIHADSTTVRAAEAHRGEVERHHAPPPRQRTSRDSASAPVRAATGRAKRKGNIDSQARTPPFQSEDADSVVKCEMRIAHRPKSTTMTGMAWVKVQRTRRLSARSRAMGRVVRTAVLMTQPPSPGP